MVNKNLFSNAPVARVKPTNTKNDAGGHAYKMEDAEILCRYVATGTFNGTYYAGGKEQLDEVKRVCANVSPELIAKAAVYGAEIARMKDVPSYLLAVLAANHELELFRKAFPRVVNSPKMLYNFIRIIRSGDTGRNSFGTAVKRVINHWITSRTGDKLFMASIGYSDPSLVDVIKMTHPKPKNREQSALFAYLLGAEKKKKYIVRKIRDTKQKYALSSLPKLVRDFEAFKDDNTKPLPDMDYRALTNLNLSKDNWREIARNMPWNTLRMNLNKLNREGVFEDKDMIRFVCDKLQNEDEIKRWNTFPYQVYTAIKNTQDLPKHINIALQKTLDSAINNVPVLGSRVAICVDTSGSMRSPVMGDSRSTTTCVEAAALLGSSILKTNLDATVIAFGTQAKVLNLNPLDSVYTNIEKIVNTNVGYGTDIGQAMKLINESNEPYDYVIFASDMQTWHESTYGWSMSQATTVLNQMWHKFKSRNKKAKLVDINLAANSTSQFPPSQKDIITIAGFSDNVFNILKDFANRDGGGSMVELVNRVEL